MCNRPDPQLLHPLVCKLNTFSGMRFVGVFVLRGTKTYIVYIFCILVGLIRKGKYIIHKTGQEIGLDDFIHQNINLTLTFPHKILAKRNLKIMT